MLIEQHIAEGPRILEGRLTGSFKYGSTWHRMGLLCLSSCSEFENEGLKSNGRHPHKQELTCDQSVRGLVACDTRSDDKPWIRVSCSAC
jgi:hypothetical protein